MLLILQPPKARATASRARLVPVAWMMPWMGARPSPRTTVVTVAGSPGHPTTPSVRIVKGPFRFCLIHTVSIALTYYPYLTTKRLMSVFYIERFTKTRRSSY